MNKEIILAVIALVFMGIAPINPASAQARPSTLNYELPPIPDIPEPLPENSVPMRDSRSLEEVKLDLPMTPGPFEPTWESIEKNYPGTPAWLREAKFGLFVHWGPYAKLAGEWQGRQVAVGENAEWIMQKLQIPVHEYRKIASQFNPIRFDADEWVALVKAAGMKYLVITAKHHDGFAMYHSQVSDYNIVDATPFGRDPMTELAEACRREGIRFCFYYSHREDWDHPDAYGNDWDYDDSEKDFERYLPQHLCKQLLLMGFLYKILYVIWIVKRCSILYVFGYPSLTG